jgi:hypothetical protein
MKSQFPPPRHRTRKLPVLTPANVNKILAKCAADLVSFVFNEKELLRQLQWVVGLYRSRTDWGKAPKERERQLAAAHKKLAHFRKLLRYLREDDTWIQLPWGQPLAEALGEVLDKPSLIATLDKVLNPPRKIEAVNIRLKSFQAQSPDEWLRGTALPKVYAQCFRQPCTGGLQSPCIRFIEAVLEELRLSCSRETIRRNITDALRSPAVRRKRSGGAVSQAISKSARRGRGEAPIK